MSQSWVRRLALAVGLAAAYAVAGRFGLRLAFVNPSATPVWAPTGIALAAFLILGLRVWPAIFIGAFLVNATTAGSAVTSLGIATGNTLEALVGAYLLHRFNGGPHALERAQHVFRFAVLAAFLSTMISATCGVTSLALGGFARWEDYGSIWLTWWLGDAGGVLIVAPVLLLWAANPRVHWSLRQTLEAAALLASLVIGGQFVFGGWTPAAVKNYPLEFLCVPIFLWAAFRFEQRDAAAAVLVLAAIAIRGTLLGFGPFARSSPNESLLLLQAFLAAVSITTLVLAAVIAERRRVEAQLRRLSVTDPLTDLANYRQLIAVIEAEIRRSQRTGRGFALLLLDVDDLKKINDRHGHLVGSRALCRLADVLRLSCRVIDTAARYGGDEFALVLPETDEAATRRVMRRVADRLTQDAERPRVTASVGLALYPSAGETVEALLGAADRALYEAKGRGGPVRRG